jgi:hypothetical protein
MSQEERRESFLRLSAGCECDRRRACSDVDIGGGRVVACLEANAASLSPGC